MILATRTEVFLFLSGETQSSTSFGPPLPGFIAPVWIAWQLRSPGFIQLWCTVRMGLPALLPEAQPGPRRHVRPLCLRKFLPRGSAASCGTAGRARPLCPGEDEGVQEDGKEIRRGSTLLHHHQLTWDRPTGCRKEEVSERKQEGVKYLHL